MLLARRRSLGLALLASLSWVLSGCWPERPEDTPNSTQDDDGPVDDDGFAGPGSALDDAATEGDDDLATQPAPSPNQSAGAEPEETEPSPAAKLDAGADTLLLNQTGNPLYEQLTGYATWRSSAGTADERLAADEELADSLLSWQMPHGGFFKYDLDKYGSEWDGGSPRSDWTGQDGVELGTIDNDATVRELMFLADVYQRSGEERHREGASRALDFLLGMQLPSGGFPQVYPAREGATYSNYVTFNDDAMARVLILLHQLSGEVPPLGGDLFSEQQREAARSTIASAVDYILNAQIEQDGQKTVWCAQHDPVTYEPREGRSYELPSKSGKESIGITSFLMTQPQTPDVRNAVEAAVAWYQKDEVRFEDTAYISRPGSITDDGYNPIQPIAGSTMWCRFYELEQDVCFFSGRLPTDDPPGTGKQYDIMDIEPERRHGYQWGGNYGTPLLEYAARVGY